MEFRGDLFFDHTDNLYRLSDEELREFNNLQGLGERFFDMDSSDDTIIRLRLRGNFNWRLAKKRKLKLMLRGSYYGHQENDVADYPRFEATLGGDVTKRDTLYGGLDLIYDRFWKNLRVGDSGFFAPGIYDQTDAHFGYVRQIDKHWTARAEFLHRVRRYEPPLQPRDRDGNYFVGSTDYRIARGFTGSTKIQLGDMETETETLTSGILIDRSYRESVAAQKFEFKLSKRGHLDLALQFRRRDFTTDEPQDDSRFDREDERWRAGLVYSHDVRKGLILEGRFRYTDNGSDRIDSTADSDQLDYTEARYAIGLRYRH